MGRFHTMGPFARCQARSLSNVLASFDAAREFFAAIACASRSPAMGSGRILAVMIEWSPVSTHSKRMPVLMPCFRANRAGIVV